MTNLLHNALSILHDQEKEYGFPSKIKKINDSEVEIQFHDDTTVKVFVNEERVVEL